MFPCNPDIGAVKGLVTRFSAMIRSCGAPCFHNNRHSAGARASGYGQSPPPFFKHRYRIQQFPPPPKLFLFQKPNLADLQE